MKVYLIAGEPSGDTLGARLMQAFADRCPDVEFYGVGGECMTQEGLKSLFDISDLAVMGFAEVVPSIPQVLKRIRQTVDDIIRVRPDVVITIDSWSFSARIHKALRRKKVGILQVHYVAPQVWAWKKKRARTMYKYIDHLLTLFPYEPKYFTPYKLPTTFVGHPVIENCASWGSGADFRKKFNFDEDDQIVAILPGSRKTEVSRLLPVFLKVAQKLKAKYPNMRFVLPAVHTVKDLILKLTASSDLPIQIVNSPDDRHSALMAADAALAASGTVALELAIVNVPHVIGYKVSALTAWLVKHFLKIQFVNLTNILLGREVIPELLQEKCNDANIVYYMDEILKKGALYERQIEGFAKLRALMEVGEQMPSVQAAETVLNLISEK